MIRERRVCAIVPARGGSKGIPRKNLYKVGGVTLVERAMHLAKACERVDKVYVSTDDPETHAIALANDCATPSLRPAALATDTARTIDVIRNLVSERVLAAEDCVLLLQPTSLLRTLVDLKAVCGILDSQWESADAVVSVCEIEGPHPYKAQIVKDGYLRSLFARDASVPRQSLPTSFMPNGAFYLAKIDVLLKEDTFIPARSVAYVMSSTASINLDGPLDLLLLEAVLKKGIVRLDDGAPGPTSPADLGRLSVDERPACSAASDLEVTVSAIERIYHESTELALIIRGSFRKDGIEFFTPGTYSQQIGYMNRPVGYVIAPHVHNPVLREVHYTKEVLFIKSGRLRVDFYSEKQVYVESKVLEAGDVILLAYGGHGFEMLEPTEIIEVKQGPYAGDRDKTRFDPSARKHPPNS